MPKKRYHVFHGPMGTVVIDRRANSWTLLSGRVVLDYGTCRGRPEYVHYLPGRAVERAERSDA
jgi:hypothetical protein